MMKIRKALSLALVALYLFAAVPHAAMTASAGESVPAIAIGSSALAKGDAVYFGKDGNQWRVLSLNGSGGTYSDGEKSVDADDALFLFSEAGIKDDAYSNNEQDNSYANSQLRKELSRLCGDAGVHSWSIFTDTERAAVLMTTKAEESNPIIEEIMEAGLENDRLFALSVNEMMTYLGYFRGFYETYREGLSKGKWWLRSAAGPAEESALAFVVDQDGEVIPSTVIDRWFFRPSFNLDLSRVLFISAAEGGKPSGGAGADQLAAVGTNPARGWKMTLKDDRCKGFIVRPGSGAYDSKTGIAQIPWEGAAHGSGCYISGIITDAYMGTVKYYGKLQELSDDPETTENKGIVTVDLKNKMGEDDRLFLFNEIAAPGKGTDYASELKEVNPEKIGHKWELYSFGGDPVEGKEPGEPGYINFRMTYKCDCNDPEGCEQHDGAHWTVLKTTREDDIEFEAPGCEKPGKYTYWFTGTGFDGKSYEKGLVTEIPGREHRYGPWKKLNWKEHQRICEYDPAHVETEDHKWDDGEVRTVDGKTVTLYTCTVCGGTKEVESGTLYAVFESRDGSLTFKREEGTYADGETVGTKTYYIVSEGKKYTDSDRPSWLARANDIRKVEFQTAVAPVSCVCWFDFCQGLKEVRGAEKLDVSCVESMRFMFNGCSSLSSPDVSGWDTSKVTDMGYMFNGCLSLSSPDVSGWDTSKVTDMVSMFEGCRKLDSLDVSGWDTSMVEHLAGMFAGCGKLAFLDVSGWDTSKATGMGTMFEGCGKLAFLDVSGWDTSKVKSMASMFNGCSKLASLDVSGWDTGNVVIMSGMFHNCSELDFLDLSGWDTSKVESMASMFTGCSSLSGVRLGDRFSFKVQDPNLHAVLPDAPDRLGCGGRWINESVTDAEGVTADNLRRCYPDSTNPDIGIGTYVWEGTAKVAVFNSDDGSLTFRREAGSFTDSEEINGKTYYIVSEGTEYSYHTRPSWLAKADDIQKVEFQATVAPASCAYWFYECGALKEVLGADRLIVSGVVSMESMFDGCGNLGSLDVSKWNTSGVQSMRKMFSACSSLDSLDVSGWDTSGVTNMEQMFDGCFSLSSVRLGERFSFKGIAGHPLYYALLPDASVFGHGGRWINASEPEAVRVTAKDLRDNYPNAAVPSFAPGEYRWEVCRDHLIATPAIDATCTEAGNSAYWACPVCGRFYSDEAGENRIEEDSWILPATGHDMTHRDASAPTCTKDGNVEYWACGSCNKNFGDENGDNELTTIIDPKTGHAYGKWKELDGKQHGRVCSHDETHLEREDHKWDGGRKSTRGARSVTLYTCTVCGATKTTEERERIYQLASGGNGSWTKGSAESLSFRFTDTEDDSGTFDHFTGITVDGKTVPETDASGRANWTKRRGSVIVELKPSYLETLSVGRHRLTAGFDDGDDVTVGFTVKKQAAVPDDEEPEEENPKTGGGREAALPFATACASLFMLLGIHACRRRRTDRSK